MPFDFSIDSILAGQDEEKENETPSESSSFPSHQFGKDSELAETSQKTCSSPSASNLLRDACRRGDFDVTKRLNHGDYKRIQQLYGIKPRYAQKVVQSERKRNGVILEKLFREDQVKVLREHMTQDGARRKIGERAKLARETNLTKEQVTHWYRREKGKIAKKTEELDLNP